MASLYDTSDGQILLNQGFLPPKRKESIEPIIAPQWRTPSRKAVKVERIMHLFIRVEHLGLRLWFLG